MASPSWIDPDADFRWRDGDRLVVFETGALEGAVRTLSERGFAGFELLSTERALAGAPDELREGAAATRIVPPTGVPEASAGLLEEVKGDALVALGGGRVIDTAKAIAAITGARVAAIPTTLSGAEMTGIHRLPAGHESKARGLVRPALVLADPATMSDAPEELVRASAMNALAHGAEAVYGPFANPVSRLAALAGVALIGSGLDGSADRRYLALGALLTAYSIDSAGLGVHHVLSQTTVRECGTPHARTNAAVLPHALEAMRARAPEAIAAIEQALGGDAGLDVRLHELAAGPAGLGELGVGEKDVDRVAAAALERLSAMGEAWSGDELSAILRRAL